LFLETEKPKQTDPTSFTPNILILEYQNNLNSNNVETDIRTTPTLKHVDINIRRNNKIIKGRNK